MESEATKPEDAVSEDGNIKRRPLRGKELDIPLTHVELAEKMRSCGKLQVELDDAKKIKKEVVAEHSNGIKELEAQLRKHNEDANRGKETRLVDCIEILNYPQALVSYEFNGQIIEERPMTPEEHQDDLPLASDDAPEESEDHDKDDDEQKSLDEQIAEDLRESTNKATASSAVN